MVLKGFKALWAVDAEIHPLTGSLTGRRSSRSTEGIEVRVGALPSRSRTGEAQSGATSRHLFLPINGALCWLRPGSPSHANLGMNGVLGFSTPAHPLAARAVQTAWSPATKLYPTQGELDACADSDPNQLYADGVRASVRAHACHSPCRRLHAQLHLTSTPPPY